MKKSFNFCLTAIFLSILFMSCASLPKKVKPGDTLVIGRVEIKAHDIESYDGLNMNGVFYSDVELELKEQLHGKTRIIKPNKNGCFYITGLKANYTYGFTKASYYVYKSDGGYVKMSVDIPEPKWFVASDNIILNIGCTYYYFDGIKKWVTWETKNHYYVKEFFQELDEESEWFSKRIVDWR